MRSSTRSRTGLSNRSSELTQLKVAFMNAYRRGSKAETETSPTKPLRGGIRTSSPSKLGGWHSPLCTPGQQRCCRRARQPVRSSLRLQFVRVGFDAALNAFLQMSADMKVAI
jgi:hypothetical protein